MSWGLLLAMFVAGALSCLVVLTIILCTMVFKRALRQLRANQDNIAQMWRSTAERLTKAGATFERYRTMYEMARDPDLVANNPLFGPSPANPSGFEYPAPRSFANMPDRQAGDPQPALKALDDPVHVGMIVQGDRLTFPDKFYIFTSNLLEK